MEIVFFNKRSQKFFESLGMAIRPRAAKTFELLEQYANELGMPHSKALGSGLFELRIVGIVSTRFIYTFYSGKIFILHGFVKKSNRIPQQEINYARTQLKKLLQ